ncbi:hypothetical protein OROMI_020212 [Orobanche minor]
MGLEKKYLDMAIYNDACINCRGSRMVERDICYIMDSEFMMQHEPENSTQVILEFLIGREASGSNLTSEP